MSQERRISEYITTMAKNIIDSDLVYLQNANCTIVFLESDQEKKKSGNRLVYGECEKVPEKYKWAVPADFLITIYTPNTMALNDEQMRILVKHELMHIGITEDADPTFYIIPHDVEEFASIIDEYGYDWTEYKPK